MDARGALQVKRRERISRPALPRFSRPDRLHRSSQLLQIEVRRQIERKIDHDAEWITSDGASVGCAAESRIDVVLELLRRKIEGFRHEQYRIGSGLRSP